MAMSTDIAEFLGAALGLNLLFHVPLFPAGLITGAIAFAILDLQRRGFRRFEIAITALLGIIFLGFLYETLKIGPSAQRRPRRASSRPRRPGSVYLAVGIIGATVMPHVIYLHSALTQGRHAVRNDARARARAALRAHRRDHRARPRRRSSTSPCSASQRSSSTTGRAGRMSTRSGGAHAGFAHLVGGTAALAFAVALFASGASSSSVGTYAGQVVMAGFINVRIPSCSAAP